ncbi:MAG: aminopeptidase P family protein [Albidovulum sp.]
MPDAARSRTGQRIAALRSELRQRNLDAFIVPRFDVHQGEYIAPHDERLAWATGFTGTAGLAIVTHEEVAVFVDGRYSVQVREECSGALFTHHHLFDEPPETWLKGRAGDAWRIGFDPMHLPPTWYDRFGAALAPVGATLDGVTGNPIDAVWHDQPAPPMGQVEPMPVQFAGQPTCDKMTGLLDFMAKHEAQLYIETQPDNIAWLLNVRGDDIPFVPAPQSFLMVDKIGTATWFIDHGKLASDTRDALAEIARIRPPGAFLTTIRSSVAKGQGVLIDPGFSPVAVRLVLEDIGADVVALPSYLTQTKARKNATELEGLRACHIQDGVAMTEFSAWLLQTVPSRAASGNPLTEREAEDKILEFRRNRPGFISESFNPISAAASNAAMCHYTTTAKRNAAILPEAPFLLDSGGQYETGTTDITRSFAFGQRPEGYDQAYTAVFKAFHALHTLRFPKGTQGHHIDAICRRPLWDLGLDYDHGTGHGVGHRLSVHEHPQRIGKPVSAVDLLPGMVISIEPGHYVAGRYGIRIENLFEIAEESDGFLAFHNLTWVPIQTDMLIQSALTGAERDWLTAYHREIGQKLRPFLSDRAVAWCQSISA